MTTVPLWEAIHAQRAVRRMSGRPVDPRLVELCVEAAVQAPSGSNAQRWEWILVSDPGGRERLAALNARQVDGYLARRPGAPARLAEGLRWMADHMAEVPWLVVPCYWCDGPGGRAVGLYASIFPAVQNFLLAATALGLGTTLTTMVLRDEDALRAALALPDGLTPCALIPLGHPSERPSVKRRRPAAASMHANRFGEGWERGSLAR